MNLLPLSQFASEVVPGVPLPWGVRDATGKLLLARGYVLADAARAGALLERGMFVDAEEVQASRAPQNQGVRSCAERFIKRWENVQGALGGVLSAPAQPGFLERLSGAVTEVQSLGAASPDLLIFLILRHDANRRTAYSITHALHVASVCSLMADRLGWSGAERGSYIGAALTMNMSIIELQGRLAGQTTPPTPAQRQQIHEHPVASANLLRQAGLDDATWLNAVEQHHETPGGGGYPNNLPEPTDMALRLRFVDMFTAKLSPRGDRAGLAPNIAARDMFKENNGHPHVAMLIRELGIYPPGCFVKLASGETAVVVGRRPAANAPLVVCITNEQGSGIASPQPRDTSLQQHAVVGTVPEKNVMVRVPWDKLYEHCVASPQALPVPTASAPTAA